MNPFFKVHEHISSIKKSGTGSAKNIPELFEKLIKFQFQNTETIIKIHNSLIDYVSSPEPIFFIRLFHDAPNKDNSLLRRGFMSEYPNGMKTVFCDNTFTELFTAMKLSNIHYNSQDLHNLFNQEKLVVGFGQSRQELEFTHYKKGKKINLTQMGWYTAHIKPTGKGFDGRSIKDFFQRPNRFEYRNDSKIRSVNNDLNETELKVVKAHFLRLTHPLNSFLSPKRQDDQYEGGDKKTKSKIGEENELLSYARDYIKAKFPKEYEEFDKLTLDYELNYNLKIKNITWDIKKKIPNKIPKVDIKKEKKIETRKHKGEIKLGSYVKSVFSYFFENNMLPPDEIESLLSPEYSKKTFGISSNELGILRHIKYGTKITTRTGNEHNRYWVDVFNKKYHIYSQWINTYEQWSNFKKWELEIKNKNDERISN